MYFLKPENISSVERCKQLVVFALVTFWAAFLAFFLAPIWGFAVLVAVHAITLYLAVTHWHRLMVFLFLSRVGEEGLPGAPNSAPGSPPPQQNGGFSESGIPPIT